MQYVCPHCNSENIQRYEVIFNNGVTASDSTTVGAGLAGSLGVGAAKTSTVSVTSLASQVAPPARKGYIKKFLLIWVAGMILAGVLSNVASALGTIVFWASFAGAIYLVYKQNYLWNKNVWPELMEHWHNSYVCMRCGEHFEL